MRPIVYKAPRDDLPARKRTAFASPPAHGQTPTAHGIGSLCFFRSTSAVRQCPLLLRTTYCSSQITPTTTTTSKTSATCLCCSYKLAAAFSFDRHKPGHTHLTNDPRKSPSSILYLKQVAPVTTELGRDQDQEQDHRQSKFSKPLPPL